MAPNPVVCYKIQQYRSHQRVGSIYKQLIGQQFALTEDLRQADIAILHIEPHNYVGIYQRFPSLQRMYVISYCVWEASVLPDSYKRSLELVQEVWTCSSFCYDVLSQYHPCVALIPHVIERDTAVLPIDRVLMRRLIAFNERNKYFLLIASTTGPQKNVMGLIRVFENTRRSLPNARLILKGRPGDPMPDTTDERIYYLPLLLSDSQVTALYEVADAYVSGHHGEGWGLCLSDAMLMGKPVIATGYSGNLEYMSDDNSYLVPYSLEQVRESERKGPYTSYMSWAYPDEKMFTRMLRQLYTELDDDSIARKVAHARADVARFNRQSVAEQITQRLDRIKEST